MSVTATSIKNAGESYFKQGNAFENGIGTNKDLFKAIFWFHKASNENEMKSKNRLKNIQAEADKKGNAEYAYTLGLFCERHGRIFEAIIWYLKVTDINSPIGVKARESLERLINDDRFEKEGVSNDANKAKDLFAYIVDHANSKFLHHLAEYYDVGVNVCVDSINYGKSTKKACDYQNIGVDSINYCKDGKRAFDLYSLAAEQGYAPAQYKLAKFYRFGRICSKNEKTAIVWYRKAADQGYHDALLDLGFYYNSGSGGLTLDAEKAKEAYKLAANKSWKVSVIPTDQNTGTATCPNPNIVSVNTKTAADATTHPTVQDTGFVAGISSAIVNAAADYKLDAKSSQDAKAQQDNNVEARVVAAAVPLSSDKEDASYVKIDASKVAAEVLSDTKSLHDNVAQPAFAPPPQPGSGANGWGVSFYGMIGWMWSAVYSNVDNTDVNKPNELVSSALKTPGQNLK